MRNYNDKSSVNSSCLVNNNLLCCITNNLSRTKHICPKQTKAASPRENRWHKMRTSFVNWYPLVRCQSDAAWQIIQLTTGACVNSAHSKPVRVDWAVRRALQNLWDNHNEWSHMPSCMLVENRACYDYTSSCFCFKCTTDSFWVWIQLNFCNVVFITVYFISLVSFDSHRHFEFYERITNPLTIWMLKFTLMYSAWQFNNNRFVLNYLVAKREVRNKSAKKRKWSEIDIALDIPPMIGMPNALLTGKLGAQREIYPSGTTCYACFYYPLVSV